MITFTFLSLLYLSISPPLLSLIYYLSLPLVVISLVYYPCLPLIIGSYLLSSPLFVVSHWFPSHYYYLSAVSLSHNYLSNILPQSQSHFYPSDLFPQSPSHYYTICFITLVSSTFSLYVSFPLSQSSSHYHLSVSLPNYPFHLCAILSHSLAFNFHVFLFLTFFIHFIKIMHDNGSLEDCRLDFLKLNTERHAIVLSQMTNN